MVSQKWSRIYSEHVNNVSILKTEYGTNKQIGYRAGNPGAMMYLRWYVKSWTSVHIRAVAIKGKSIRIFVYSWWAVKMFACFVFHFARMSRLACQKKEEHNIKHGTSSLILHVLGEIILNVQTLMMYFACFFSFVITKHDDLVVLWPKINA